jgi:hypothetical protein
MPYSINITGISGGTAPIGFYVCDENGNNCELLGYTAGIYVLPTFFQNATTIMIKSVDSGGCIFFKIISCFDTCYILTEDEFELMTENGDNLTFCD